MLIQHCIVQQRPKIHPTVSQWNNSALIIETVTQINCSRNILDELTVPQVPIVNSSEPR
jgi:hypothetical protein